MGMIGGDITQLRFQRNSIDAVRLCAALQVAFLHSATQLNVDLATWPLIEVIRFFPGVPIFFFISGFLISRSYENSASLGQYFTNRALRIYPALIACTLVSCFVVYLTGYFDQHAVPSNRLITWIVAQISVLQFYNPEFMRGFGVGVLNGSLWTITVELQFYVLTPFLYRFGLSRSPRWTATILLCVIVISIALNMFYKHVQPQNSEELLVKLLGVSCGPWLYMYIIGMVCQRQFGLLHALMRDKAIVILVFYLTLAYVASRYWQWSLGNTINPVLFACLCILVLSVSYTGETWTANLLKGNDVSYGIYIYHMPIVNTFLYLGFQMGRWSVSLVLLSTIVAAVVSWLLIEKPSLSLKRRSMRPRESLESI